MFENKVHFMYDWSTKYCLNFRIFSLKNILKIVKITFLGICIFSGAKKYIYMEKICKK